MKSGADHGYPFERIFESTKDALHARLGTELSASALKKVVVDYNYDIWKE